MAFHATFSEPTFKASFEKEKTVRAVAGSGGIWGGTKDYSNLSNKPSINSHELLGNKTGDELELASKATIQNVASSVPTVATASEVLAKLT